MYFFQWNVFCKFLSRTLRFTVQLTGKNRQNQALPITCLFIVLWNKILVKLFWATFFNFFKKFSTFFQIFLFFPSSPRFFKRNNVFFPCSVFSFSQFNRFFAPTIIYIRARIFRLHSKLSKRKETAWKLFCHFYAVFYCFFFSNRI